MSKAYRVLLKVDGPADESLDFKREPVELAAFATLEEAAIFQRALELQYAAAAGGEGLVLEQMTSPKNFVAGD